MNELTGADFKSATADDNKKLFIETYGLPNECGR